MQTTLMRNSFSDLHAVYFNQLVLSVMYILSQFLLQLACLYLENQFKNNYMQQRVETSFDIRISNQIKSNSNHDNKEILKNSKKFIL